MTAATNFTTLFGGDWHNDNPVVRRECGWCRRWKPVDQVEKGDCSDTTRSGRPCPMNANICVDCVPVVESAGYAGKCAFRAPRALRIEVRR